MFREVLTTVPGTQGTLIFAKSYHGNLKTPEQKDRNPPSLGFLFRMTRMRNTRGNKCQRVRVAPRWRAS